MKGKKAIQSKFPTARIKKIMQEDEEIGKIAAGAPIVISRALELFLKDIVLESTHIARAQGSKKVMPYHIKRLAAQNRTYDFLDDMLAKYSDPTGGAVSGGGGGASGSAAGAGGEGSRKPKGGVIGGGEGSRAPVVTNPGKNKKAVKMDDEEEEEEDEEDLSEDEEMEAEQSG